VNVLQAADRLRVQHVLAGGDPSVLADLVSRDAAATATLGEHLLEMLDQAQLTVGASARAVPD